jgi:hypothetical protein
MLTRSRAAPGLGLSSICHSTSVVRRSVMPWNGRFRAELTPHPPIVMSMFAGAPSGKLAQRAGDERSEGG